MLAHMQLLVGRRFLRGGGALPFFKQLDDAILNRKQ